MVPATRGFRVGRIAGVEVRLDWSLLIVFWLIVMSLGGGLFPARHPDWSPMLIWGMAGFAAVLFLASVLAHELSHALVGRAQGIEVVGITLFIFGGMAHMRGEPRSPRAELLMAGVGPVTSLVIGFVATLWGSYLVAPGALDPAEPLRAFQAASPLATVLLWLGPLNIMLGVFNLIPGFPLDGGRVLRAALWATTRDYSKATRWAAGIGQAVGLLFILAGVAMMLGGRVPFLGRGLVSGLWIAFIGWFLKSAAASSYSQVMVSDLLDDVPVSRLMKRQPITVDAGVSVAEFVDGTLMATAERAFPVVDGADRDRLLGIVTMEDVRKVPRDVWSTTRVSDIMTNAPEVAVALPSEPASVALQKLASRNIEQLPVVDGGRLVGLLRRLDIMRWLELQQPRGRGSGIARERHA
jgi:Zn-dependent protease/CBS domain-containing protein